MKLDVFIYLFIYFKAQTVLGLRGRGRVASLLSFPFLFFFYEHFYASFHLAWLSTFRNVYLGHGQPLLSVFFFKLPVEETAIRKVVER